MSRKIANELRTNTISVRLSDVELFELDRRRMKTCRGTFLWISFFHSLPQSVPELNREAWAKLAKAAANLNQIARRINEIGVIEDLSEVKKSLVAFRLALVGAVFHES